MQLNFVRCVRLSVYVVLSIGLLLLGACTQMQYDSRQAAPNRFQRSQETIIDDNAIASKGSIKLHQYSRELDNARINVISYNRTVLLLGQVPSLTAKQDATVVMSQFSNVKTIHNHLSVGDSISVGEQLHDSWLTTKVKSALLFNRLPNAPNEKDLQIRVFSENNVVYLMGMLTKADESDVVQTAAAAIDQANTPNTSNRPIEHTIGSESVNVPAKSKKSTKTQVRTVNPKNVDTQKIVKVFEYLEDTAQE